MSSLKASVLQTFKKLHRTRLKVFAGDVKALSAARAKINEEYKKNINVKDIESIKAMNKFAEDVIKELGTQVIQAKEVKKGVYDNTKYELETEKYDDDATQAHSPPSNKRPKVEEHKKYELETGEYDDDATQADSPPSYKRPLEEVARITKDTVKLDNIPFNEEMISEEGVRRGKSKCCQDISQNK